jgi:hypothetical protein
MKSALGGKPNNNKIRVVVRMRPFLDGEPAELAKMSNVMAQGALKVRDHDNEIHVFPKS